jgi:hypothetical protein
VHQALNVHVGAVLGSAGGDWDLRVRAPLHPFLVRAFLFFVRKTTQNAGAVLKGDLKQEQGSNCAARYLDARKSFSHGLPIGRTGHLKRCRIIIALQQHGCRSALREFM